MSFEQVEALREECDALGAVLEPLDDAAFETITLFKGWTFHDVVAHLHLFNWAADASIHRPEEFDRFWADLQRAMASGRTLREATDGWLGGAHNRAAFERWRDFYPGLCDRLDGVDPRQRVKWAGPPMSVRSSVTARQMETWAHGQEVWDALGLERVDTDRIENIAVLGVNTFAWTYRVRGLAVPAETPFVRLEAPSGAVWEWNAPNADHRVEGSATEFCQVVTQVRNVADTTLRASGPIAREWMTMAQCFAGPPESPPPPGARHRAR
ncbi:MAG TPA: TIGR03084 family metal-binding protein [Thermoanaerobaculia bacterium]|nr:TIGR03084 family metal-binding protein [Thermoanaerobaculia bacterium]